MKADQSAGERNCSGYPSARPALNPTFLKHESKMSPAHLLSIVTTLLITTSVRADNWPAWRGSFGTGVCVEKNLPLRWSTNENVRWRAPLPERGNSTPIVWNERVFVTQAVEEEKRRTLMCFDRRNGKLLWQTGVTSVENEVTHGSNPSCSASPVTD